MLAGSCAIAPRLLDVHRIVAALAGVYVAMAVPPWAVILISRW